MTEKLTIYPAVNVDGQLEIRLESNILHTVTFVINRKASQKLAEEIFSAQGLQLPAENPYSKQPPYRAPGAKE